MKTLAEESIEKIDYELALEELSRLDEGTREEIVRWVEHDHYDRFHGPNKGFGIYACHIFMGPGPHDPRKREKP